MSCLLFFVLLELDYAVARQNYLTVTYVGTDERGLMLGVVMLEPFKYLGEGVGIGIKYDVVGRRVETLRQTMRYGMVEVVFFHQPLHLSKVIAFTHEQEFLLTHIIHDDILLFFLLMELLLVRRQPQSSGAPADDG